MGDQGQNQQHVFQPLSVASENTPSHPGEAAASTAICPGGFPCGGFEIQNESSENIYQQQIKVGEREVCFPDVGSRKLLLTATLS